MLIRKSHYFILMNCFVFLFYFIFSHWHLHSKKCVPVRLFCQKEFSFIVQKFSFSFSLSNKDFPETSFRILKKKSPKNSIETFTKSVFYSLSMMKFLLFLFSVISMIILCIFKSTFSTNIIFPLKLNEVWIICVWCWGGL